MSNSNEPAYPFYNPHGMGFGLTKREYFAAMVLANCAIDCTDGARPQHYEYAAKFCVSMSDALIKELEKTA